MLERLAVGKISEPRTLHALQVSGELTWWVGEGDQLYHDGASITATRDRLEGLGVTLKVGINVVAVGEGI